MTRKGEPAWCGTIGLAEIVMGTPIADHGPVSAVSPLTTLDASGTEYPASNLGDDGVKQVSTKIGRGIAWVMALAETGIPGRPVPGRSDKIGRGECQSTIATLALLAGSARDVMKANHRGVGATLPTP